MKSLKQLLVLLMSIFYSASCVSTTKLPYGSDPIGFLGKKNDILYVMKVAGYISYAEYAEAFSHIENLDRWQVKEKWKMLVKDKKEKFVVLKAIKSKKFSPGSVLTFDIKSRFYDAKVVGGRYVLFLDKTENTLDYEDFNYAELDGISLKESIKLLSGDYIAVTKRIYESFLMVGHAKEIK